VERDLSGLREQYRAQGLDEGDIDPDPLTQFDRWFAEWVAWAPPPPNAGGGGPPDGGGGPAGRGVVG
jgi:pyridoxamine 5'-phosphate oxidase